MSHNYEIPKHWVINHKPTNETPDGAIVGYAKNINDNDKTSRDTVIVWIEGGYVQMHRDRHAMKYPKKDLR